MGPGYNDQAAWAGFHAIHWPSLASLALPTSRDRPHPASARSPRPTSTCRPIGTRDAGPHPRRAASRPVTSRPSLRHVTAARRALASGWEAPPRPLTGQAPRRGGSRAPGPPARELAHGSVGGCLREGSEASGARDLEASLERLRRAAAGRGAGAAMATGAQQKENTLLHLFAGG